MKEKNCHCNGKRCEHLLDGFPWCDIPENQEVYFLIDEGELSNDSTVTDHAISDMVCGNYI